MAGTISLDLVGANPTATVLTNLTSGPAVAKASINSTLNASLKSDLAAVIDQGGYPAIAGLLKEMPAVDIAANQNATLQAFLTAQLDLLVAKDPAMKQAVDAELANVSTATTVGRLLNLNQPLQSHPLFAVGVNQAQLGELLSTNPLLAASTQLQTDFINAYAASTGSMADFWAELSKNEEFTGLIPQLQLTLQLGAFTLNNTPLVAALQTALNVSTFRELTQLTAATLTNLITSNNIQVPAGIPGQTAADYAAAMMSLLKAAFPTDFVAQGLQTSTDPLNKGVATFLANSKDFDLAAATNVTSYIQQNYATAFKGIASDQVSAVKNRLLAVRRLFRVNSDPGVIQTLIRNGLDSARKIASMPQAIFMRQFTQALGGQSTALLVYNGARQIAGVAFNLYRTIQEAVQQANPAAIGNSTGTFSDTLNQIIPNWQTLFGSTSYCECDECNAMDGPAAYFVDLLQFLQGANTGGGVNPQNASDFTPLDVLIGYQNNPNNYQWTTTNGTATKGALNPLPTNVIEFSVPASLDPPPVWAPSIAPSTPGDMPTEVVVFSGIPICATVGGTVTSGDSVILSMTADVPGSPVNVTYTVAPSDTPSSIAAALAALINSNSTLKAANISASVSSPIPPPGRRPDLAYLKLTCANSDTPLPYVDLINEILESYVYYVGMGTTVANVTGTSPGSTLTLPSPAPSNFPDAGNIISVNSQSLSSPIAYVLGPDQVTLTLTTPLSPVPSSPFTIGLSALALASNNTPSDAAADELSVNPEYTISAVYSGPSGPLVSAIYPFRIPYDRYLDTARIYLNFLGSSRYQLIQSFGVFSAAQDRPAMMAAESLSLSQAEYELISQYIYSAANAYTFYGYSGASVTQPNATGTVQTLPWNQWIIQVPEFLKRTGLAYTDLVALLETEYLNPGQT
ncbi:MAG TPA: hypothetical protein VI756_16670, partial [Blastocatellia bacterium]